MKKPCFIPALLLFLFVFTKTNAQTTDQSSSNPFKYVYDHFGKKYELKDLFVSSPKIGSLGGGGVVTPRTLPGKGYSPNQTNTVPSLTCSAGYFNLYFDGAATSVFTLTAARDIACQVYTDLSNFITAASPLSVAAGVGPKINVLCDRLTYGTNLAQATSFYAVPNNPSNPDQGLTDGLVYKFLTTGVDPLTLIPAMYASPASSPGAQTQLYYHGYMLVKNIATWNVPVTSLPSSIQNDLYSVILHEAMHMLGYQSFIGSTGTSLLGSANNYFNRYDKFLTNAAGTPLLKNALNNGCTGSNLKYSGPLTNIAPGGAFAICTTNAKFVGGSVDEKVYTPPVYAPGASLSHLEDACNGHIGGCGSGPGLYFVMASNGTPGTCYVKRYPREEERQALCTLGYNCSILYNCSAPGALAATFNYGSFCTPIILIGMNDGLVNGNYTYNTTGNSINIPTSMLLANDVPSSGLSVSCVEVIYTNSFNNAGFTMVGNNLVVSANAGSGLLILKYYPFNGTDMGNATYVYVQFNSSNCNSPVNCNLAQNGSFENITGSPSCGELGVNLPATAVNCWAPAEGDPAVFTRACNANTTFELGVNTLGASPGVIESFNGSPNNSVIGLNYVYGTTNTEAIKNYLSAPLVPGINYDLSFMLANPVASLPYNDIGDPVVITVCALPLFNSAISVPYAAGAMEVIAEFTVSAGTNWQQVSASFVFAPVNNTIHQAIVIGINPNKTWALVGGAHPEVYFYLDQVSLIENNSVYFFTGNPTICGTTGIPDLLAYTNFPGTFSGTGVSFANGLYSFNTGPNPLPPGQYPIAFIYAINGCSYTSYQFITISSNTNLLALTPNLCVPSVVINLTSLITNPAFIVGTTFTVNSIPTGTPYTFGQQGDYTVVASNSNGALCNNTATTVMHYYTVPAAPITLINGVAASSTLICMGDSQLLFVNAMVVATAYQWDYNSVPNSFFTPIPNPTVTTVYSVVAYNNVYCPSTQVTFTINVDPNCCTSNLPTYTGGSSVSGIFSTPLYFPNSILVPTGNSLTLDNAEFQFGPNAQLIVAPGAQLNLKGTHLYSCGPQMWQGIVGWGNSQITTTQGNQDNLIEDAMVGMYIIAQNNPGVMLSVDNTVFNKNHVDIRIEDFASNSLPYPFSVHSCVFTCRNLPFTPTTWPGVANTAPGLRESTPGQPQESPYKLQNYSLSTLKSPYTGEPSFESIQLVDVGLTSGSIYNNIDIGDLNLGNFNLFDAHGTFINAENCNISSINNVFQNTKVYYAPSTGLTQWGAAILHTTNNLLNTSLEIRYGQNYFYDCHKAVSGSNTFRLDMQGVTLSSNQNVSGGTAFLPGNTGVELSTNRTNYFIGGNIFSNIKDCIKMQINNGTYDMGVGPQNGTYIYECRVFQNYFGAQVSSSMPLSGQYTNRAVDILGVNSGAWSGMGVPIRIYSNRVDRGYRGFRIAGLNGFPCEIKSNDLLLADEPATIPQYGIEVLNTLSNLIINSNYVEGPNKLNNNMSLVYLDNNILPTITCNTTKLAYNAFVFNGANNGIWMGNVMKSHARGLVLQNNGVINAQGNPSTRSDNQWAGSWALPDYETYVLASNAAFSPLFVATSAGYLPVNNGGVATGNYNGAGNLQAVVAAAYTCTNTGLPPSPQYREASETGLVDLSQKNSNMSIFPNPTSGKLSIAGNEESETIKIVVSDLSGKKVFEQQLRTQASRSEIFLDLDNGVYFIYILKATSGERTVRKLIIAK